MYTPVKTGFLFSTFTLFFCLSTLFLSNTAAQVDDEHGAGPDDAEYTFVNVDVPSIAFLELTASSDFNYTFESIEVPGVDFLEVTASNDFEDYAGHTRSPDGENIVGFTRIDGVFTTYHFPGAKHTYFYALGNTGIAAGYYEDSNGLHHGVILEDGELRQYDFPGAVETFIHGISDATGALTGNYIDAEGVRRGFSGETIIEIPGASETYADFVNATGRVVGSYVDAEGLYHMYMISPGRITSLNFPHAETIEYLFAHGVNQALIYVVRIKRVGDVPRTYVGGSHGVYEFRFPGSVSTQGWNINEDGSVVGYYDTADGRRHGFIARPDADTAPHVSHEPVEISSAGAAYTFESIDVPGVDFLQVTASSDFEDYAGNTRQADGEKMVGFTLIDGIFTTYDFPGAKHTYFYALGNNGDAAGHSEDSEGLHHGVVLKDGELKQYDFPGAVETFIHGISDATGALTGNYIDAEGVRRGFSGDIIVEFPGAVETYADFVNEQGSIVGSYVDAEGEYEGYVRTPDERFLSLDYTNRADLRRFTDTPEWEYIFLHGISDANVIVARSKAVGDLPRTYVGGSEGLHELRFPGSVSTQGWNINQDGSVVGHYDTPDGRRHGFIARPTTEAESTHFGNFYTVTLSKGLNMLSVPLAPRTPMMAKTLVALTGATTVITLDTASQRFVAWTPDAPDDGFPIEGGTGYIVNIPKAREFAFVGAPWTDPAEEAPAAPTAISTQMPQAAWAFVVSGHLEGKPAFDGYQISVRNLRTNTTITAPVQADYFAAATADLTRQSVVEVGDVIEVRVMGPNGNAESHPLTFKVTPEHLANAVLSLRLDGIGQPEQHLLLQNYPNPFNPETWIPYQLSKPAPVTVSIYDLKGTLIRRLTIGHQPAGFYTSRRRAAYWDGRNTVGEPVASGVYFYTLTAGDFTATRKLLIRK